MSESIRQRKVAELLKEQMSLIFQKNGFYTLKGSLVTITSVSITPDLLEAKFYLSIFNAKDKMGIIDELETHHKEIRHQLGNKIAKQVRRVPEFVFYLDETLDEVFKMENLFQKIKDIDNPKAE
ncbi:MAG: ribosome-binding factor RbfA [Bacteroidota bacterium]|jgi:ribosome-binding factor A